MARPQAIGDGERDEGLRKERLVRIPEEGGDELRKGNPNSVTQKEEKTSF
jgi:hypothetical protein